MEVERPKLPASFVVVAGAIGVVVAVFMVRWVFDTVLGLLRLGFMIAVVAAVIAVVVRLKSDDN